jgi:hypothetical protein
MLARPQLTPDIAQRYLDEIDTELARRAAKRMEAGRFLDFCRDPDLFQEYPVFYHEDLCATLQRIESGEIKRAMFFLPPGAAKSTYGSVRFPCWYLGRNPSKRVIHGCNVKELAEDFGRKVRNLIASRDFRAVFPEVVLSSDSAAAGRWDLGAGGGYYGVGRGGAVTGRRADLAILDDVIKGREEADSETVREKAWQWGEGQGRRAMVCDQPANGGGAGRLPWARSGRAPAARLLDTGLGRSREGDPGHAQLERIVPGPPDHRGGRHHQDLDVAQMAMQTTPDSRLHCAEH